MAIIKETLSVIDQFSGPLGRFINKMAKAATCSEETAKATQKMSAETQWLVDKLGILGQIHQTTEATAEQSQKYVSYLTDKMTQLGLVWADTAAEENAANLLVNQSVRSLAAQGLITADSLAKLEYEEEMARKKMEELGEETETQTSRFEKLASVASEAFKKLSSKITAPFKQMSQAGEKGIAGLSRQLTRFSLSIFSVQKILTFLKSSLERAPKSVQDSWAKAGNTISNLFGGAVISVLKELQPHIDKLNEALNSEAGQKLARGLQIIGSAAGQAIGFALDIVSRFVEFLGNNFSTVVTTAAIIAGIFAVKMLLVAAATAAANLPLLLFIGLLVAIVSGLISSGVTAEEIFKAIGSGVGFLYAFVYNIIADVWNEIAIFAEFLLNVFDDKLGSIGRLFFDTFDRILNIVETVAKAIDKLLGTDMSGGISRFRSKMQKWADDKFGESKIKVERMEKLDYGETMDKFSEKFGSIGKSLDNLSLDGLLGGASIPDIASNTGDINSGVQSIEKSVNMADEDIKSLVDMAERRYVNQVNLTSQTPIINITGANTGNTAEDRKTLANAIRDILIEQTSSAAVRSTARAF